MKCKLWVCLLVLGLMLSWTLVYAADFFVIPTKKKNYAPVQKTGQGYCYYDNGISPDICICGSTNCPSQQDGGLEKGVTWPTPRFTDNGNGTVTDKLTDLIWMKNANCTRFWMYDRSFDNERSWGEALSACDMLSGHILFHPCGITDGSSEGDWRLPHLRELQSLIDYGYCNPALSNAAGTKWYSDGDPFDGVQNWIYWSSTTYAPHGINALTVYLRNGTIVEKRKYIEYKVWCVRDPK